MITNRPVWASRRWQLAFWGVCAIGATLFSACAWDLSWWPYVGAWFSAWLTGFLAAVLVEIGTQ